MNAENIVLHNTEITTYFTQGESGVFVCRECGKVFVTDGKQLVVMQKATADEKGNYREVSARHTFSIPVGLTRKNRKMIVGEEYLGAILVSETVDMAGGAQGKISEPGKVSPQEIVKSTGIPTATDAEILVEQERLAPFENFLNKLDEGKDDTNQCTP